MFEANAKLPTGTLRDLMDLESSLLYLPRAIKVIHQHCSSQTRKATADCCLHYQISNDIDQNRILNNMYNAKHPCINHYIAVLLNTRLAINNKFW